MFEVLLAFSVFVIGLVIVDLHFGNAEAKRGVWVARDAGK